MKILAIESSCDETAAAIIETGDRPKIITNIVASQIAEHAKWGGVFPEKASRMHCEAIGGVLTEATQNKKIDYDAIAVTNGPGLIGSLLIGTTAAKTLAMVESKPLYAINHLEGHIYSAFIDETPELPALFLIISGGHSDLVLMKKHLEYKTLGYARDDAAGEAFDKVARLLGLGYPGGPLIAKLAENGDGDAYELPIALKGEKTYDLSFSGLKASVANLVGKLGELNEKQKADIAASFQKTVAVTIGEKMQKALNDNPDIKTVGLVGGVSANKYLRDYIAKMVDKDIKFIAPNLDYSTDNAAMIGAAAVFKAKYGRPTPWQQLKTDPNLTLDVS